MSVINDGSMEIDNYDVDENIDNDFDFEKSIIGNGDDNDNYDVAYNDADDGK